MAGLTKNWVSLVDVEAGQRVRLVKIEGSGNGRRRGHCNETRRMRGWFGLGRHCGHGGEDCHGDARVAGQQGGRKNGRGNGGSLCHRLAELGLTPGVEFEILQRGSGPMILAVRDSRLALGRGTASKVVVEITDNPKDE